MTLDAVGVHRKSHGCEGPCDAGMDRRAFIRNADVGEVVLAFAHVTRLDWQVELVRAAIDVEVAAIQ